MAEPVDRLISMSHARGIPESARKPTPQTPKKPFCNRLLQIPSPASGFIWLKFGCGVWGLEFGVRGSGFGVWGSRSFGGLRRVPPDQKTPPNRFYGIGKPSTFRNNAPEAFLMGFVKKKKKKKKNNPPVQKKRVEMKQMNRKKTY